MRGKIKNRQQVGRVVDFSGLRWGSITPTDIDGFIDFGGKKFVVFELKYGGAPLPKGQRLAIERLVDGLEKGGSRAIAFICTHNDDGDIAAANAVITEYRLNGEWRESSNSVLLPAGIEWFRKA
jgi:hypothetical protein